ncbi:ribbon-helix-helix domain-containing protein [Blastochloris sulfoviridis]|uniref:Type II toxin-antitoxin system ParD family antitoxin n=1 Tax=Blastochloris sulfoviridis TaxID=50712 RepID=A0A5M6HU63_9HYPH|nr:type II toxin-antitoxin system ParD family antitoxin [Blastochloris sulfoviridis]KAA5599178.1 type II toxin-antitoxin system ParD family antitoxin [Blastochloris sulfoviridis]
MSPTRQLTVTLPEEVVRAVEARVAAGEYASASEVVLDGLMQLDPFADEMPPIPDEEVERWLREEVVPTCQAYLADPSRAIPAEEVFDGLERRYLARKAKQKNNIKA